MGDIKQFPITNTMTQAQWLDEVTPLILEADSICIGIKTGDDMTFGRFNCDLKTIFLLAAYMAHDAIDEAEEDE